MPEPDVTFRAGVRGLIPDAWIVGQTAGDTLPPLVAVHGITRGVEEMVTLLAPRARATGRTIVVPHFDRVNWPRYQRAACSHRADWALLRLMSALRQDRRVGDGRFDLSGFSGGAQFAHRFAWLYPDMVGRLCATAPGWWTFPDAGASWPYGMAPGSGGAESFRLQANLRRFLDREIVVCVGSDDVERDANLRQGGAIDVQQGATRVERARRWCAAAEAAARAEGLRPNITLRVLQGCGHSFADCVIHGGLDRDFAPVATRCAASRCGSCQLGAICRSISTSHFSTIERTAA
jgi:pimeloyl-ACP methyl ester carboxylesterase